MLIKFKRPDPRAGMVVRMDSSRGRQLVEIGAADRLLESGVAEVAPVAPQAVSAEQVGSVEQAPRAATRATRGKK